MVFPELGFPNTFPPVGKAEGVVVCGGVENAPPPPPVTPKTGLVAIVVEGLLAGVDVPNIFPLAAKAGDVTDCGVEKAPPPPPVMPNARFVAVEVEALLA